MTTNSSTGVLPPFSLSLITATGENDPSWLRWFFKIEALNGGTQNINLSTVNIKSTLALTTASRAAIVATTADVLASTANTNSEAAQATGIQNTAQIQQLSSAQTAFMVKSNNLSDITSASTARTNLDISFFPFYANFDVPTSSLTKIIPIGRSYQIPANFSGSTIYANQVGTTDNIFTISYIRSGVTTVIGQIGLVHSGNFPITPVGNATTLQVGDILKIVAPTVVDATLREIGIMIATVLV